ARNTVISRDSVQVTVGEDLPGVQAETVGFFLKQLLTQIDRSCPLALRKVVTNLGSGTRRFCKIHPVARGMRGRRSHDFDDIAVSKLILQWHDPAIDLCPVTCESHLSVNHEREINRRGSSRQLYYLSLRRKAINFFRI